MRAVVVGAGPNGLTAAATLARAGLAVTVFEAQEEIGGGTRSSELTLPGLVHDHCAAVHPFAVAAPSYRALELGRHGLSWRWPDVDLAHPLDDGSAAVLMRSLETTARGLGPDARRWRELFGASSSAFDGLAGDLMTPMTRRPRHPLALARFGALAALPAATLARAFATPRARALFAGIAAHGYSPLSRPFSAATGVALVCAGHRGGWPAAAGGSRAISDALASVITAHGGTIVTGTPITDLRQLPAADVVMLDLTPSAVADLAGDRLPPRIARAYRRYRHGPAAFKVDVAVAGGVPWTSAACRRAGTVHAIGGIDELARAERDVNDGRMPERPFVLVSQQALADPGRARGDLQPISAYAHVPHDHRGDVSAAVLAQIERFAPGFGARVEAVRVTSPSALAASNANLVGGDILTGAGTPLQTVARPRASPSPYATGIDGTYICSAATPPGPGAHGMNGYNAARAALRRLRARARG